MAGAKYTWYQILQDKWWIGPLSFAASLIVTPIVRHIGYKRGIVDRPDDLLKPHARPVSYLGGVAMCIGLLAGIVGYLTVMPNLGANWSALTGDLAGARLALLLHNPLWNLIFIALAATVITVVGLLDDIKDISPSQKVMGQLLAGSLLLGGGVATRSAGVFLDVLGLGGMPWLVLFASIAMCFIMVVACCNATNLLDGLDGLCGGVGAIIGIGFLVLTIWLAMWGNIAAEMDGLRVALCLATVGTILGFLPYNMHPASIFMGDAGSMFLGFMVATIMILFCQEGHARWILSALVVFAVPVMDTALAVVRRILAGRSIFAGDRSHFYDQLIDRGMGLKRVVSLFYLLSVLAGLIGVLGAILLRTRHALALYSLLFVAVWIMFHWTGMIRERTGKAARADLPKHRRRHDESPALNILFSPAGRRVSLLQLFRQAADDAGIDLTIHAVDRQPLAPALQAADKTGIVPAIHSDAYIESLLHYCRANSIDALIPLLDTNLPVIADAFDRFAEIGTRAVISDPQVIQTVSDKILTREFLVQHGFDTPHILTEEELRSPSLPLFTKPRYGSASLRAIKVTTPEELAFLHQAHPDDIVQEYVDGIEYTVDVFTDLDGNPLCAVPRKRHEVRAGEVSKSQTVRHRGIIEQSCRLVKELAGCRGMITIQCFLTSDGRIVFIEINPRFGGGVPLSIHAGADSPRWLMELLVGRRPDIHADAWTDQLFMLRYDKGIFVPQSDLPQNHA